MRISAATPLSIGSIWSLVIDCMCRPLTNFSQNLRLLRDYKFDE